MKKFNHVGSTLTELQTENIDGSRFYKTPNGNYQSITTLLSNLSKAGIQAWRARVGEEEANRMLEMRIGTDQIKASKGRWK